MTMRLRELIITLKDEGKRLSYGREIKYHWSTAKYPGQKYGVWWFCTSYVWEMAG